MKTMILYLLGGFSLICFGLLVLMVGVANIIAGEDVAIAAAVIFTTSFVVGGMYCCGKAGWEFREQNILHKEKVRHELELMKIRHAEIEREVRHEAGLLEEAA